MNILIIGKDSYIGNHIDQWLQNKGHKVWQLDALTDEWRNCDYSPYDAVVHVAGIVHRPNCTDWELYHRVNVVMPVAIAQKAKLGGGKEFYFFQFNGRVWNREGIEVEYN